MARELKTEKAIIAKFESLREEKDELSSSLAARSGDLQAGLRVHAASLPFAHLAACKEWGLGIFARIAVK